MTKASTYRGAWEAATGAPGPPVAAALAAKTGATCLSYSMILADMSAQLLGVARTPALLGTTSTLLLPLCLLDTSKTFALLRFSSALGLGANRRPALGGAEQQVVEAAIRVERRLARVQRRRPRPVGVLGVKGKDLDDHAVHRGGEQLEDLGGSGGLAKGRLRRAVQRGDGALEVRVVDRERQEVREPLLPHGEAHAVREGFRGEHVEGGVDLLEVAVGMVL